MSYHFELFKTILLARLSENPKLNIHSDLIFDELYNSSKFLSERFVNASVLLEEQKKQLKQLLSE